MIVYNFKHLGLITDEHKRKSVNFSCTKARTPFENKEVFIKELDLERPVCMEAVYIFQIL